MLTFHADGDAFSVSFMGKTLVSHTPETPMVTLGKGRSDIKMNHSSFKIKDRLTDKKPLLHWELTESEQNRTTIVFEKMLTVRFQMADGRFEICFSGNDPAFNRFWVNLVAYADEHLYGCGEQYSVLDLKGLKLPIWVEEQGVGRGKDLITFLANVHSGSGGTWYTTYYAHPTFVSSKNYYCHIESTAYCLMDFSKKTRHWLHVWEIPEKIVMDVAPTAKETIGKISEFLGRQPRLPDWVYDGMWLGVQGGTDVVTQKLKDAQNAGIPVSAVWAQDWEGIRITSFGKQLMWNWKFDAELYPNLPDTIQSFNQKGIRFLGYINPMLALEGDLYQYASKNNYLVKNPDGTDALIYITTFPAAVVDFTNPDAKKWYKDVIKTHLIGIGLSGWMADFGEGLPVNGILHSGESGEKAHNEYPLLWAQVNREAVEEAGKLGEIVFFSRSGFARSSRYATAIWAGDQNVNWSMDDGLATVIPAALSLGFGGIGFHHSDIGGYTTVAWIKRSKEVLLRWVDHCAFTPIMRTHEGNRPDENWQFNSDPETLHHFAKMVRVYVALKPYHHHLSEQYVTTGLPPIRHPYLHYETDKILHTLMYQYLYGEDMMVAPVFKPGKKTMKVYLPEDAWIHLWTGDAYSGGWHTVDAPIGRPPVFYRKASGFKNLFESLKT